MEQIFKRILLTMIIALISGCSTINSEKNVDTGSIKYLLSIGNCKAALEKTRPIAEKGEPLAQYHMGIIPIDERCKNKPTPKEFGEMLDWLTKSGCYKSRTAWERGDKSIKGKQGFYNTRDASKQSAIMLAKLYSNQNMIGASWWWIDHSMKMYSKTDSEFKKLNTYLKKIESNMKPDYLNKIRNNKDNLCSKV